MPLVNIFLYKYSDIIIYKYYDKYIATVEKLF